MDRLKEFRKATGLSQKQVADRLGTTDVSVSRYESGDQRITVQTLKKMAEIYGTTVAELLGESPPASARKEYIDVPEYDVQASAGGGFHVVDETVKDVWPFSREYLRHTLRVTSTSLVVIEVRGDSMEPALQSGDRVLIDLSDRSPTQPGIFVLWDGDGTVVKRLEKIPYSDPPEIVIKSDNPLHDTYIRPADIVKIVGRVIWFGRRL